jgi:glyoxylase-like metal-dependent hydrolase (beta-lactamase superfamily II)
MTTNSKRALLSAGLLVCGFAVLSAPSKASAETPYTVINAAAAANPITVDRLRGNISALEGSGGNIGVLSGPDGLLLVDAGIAVSQQKIVDALHRIDPGALRYVINTHWHWDHTDGNGWVRRAGATIIADKNAVKRLQQDVRVVEWDHTFTPVPKADLPNRVITADMTMHFDGETIRIRHYRPGHTDGDMSVYFVKADVLQTGDTFWNGVYPFIDYATGGSIDGAIRSANVNLTLATGHSIVIPGHGPVGDRAQLIAFRDMLVAVRAKVAALKAQGKSVDEVVAAKPSAAYDAKWGKSVIDGALFTALVYRGV